MKVKFAILILVLCVTSASGQKVSDIEKEYGTATQVYSLSEHIWMTPEYGIDGEICRARLYPKRISPGTNYLSKELPFQKLIKALNRLIPLGQRGAAKEFFGDTELSEVALAGQPIHTRTCLLFSSSSPGSIPKASAE